MAKAAEQDESVWTELLETVSQLIPKPIRADILKFVLAREECDPGIEILSEYGDGTYRHLNAQYEAKSLAVQMLVREITNNHSPDDAAKILFRAHRHGFGGRWLPEYLDSIPGLTVNIKKAAQIRDLSGDSKLYRTQYEENAN